jgi:hypothetical protein
MTPYLRDAKLGIAEVTPDCEPWPPRLDDSDRVIMTDLEERPLSSVRQISRATHIPHVTVYRRPTKLLGFVRRLLRWVPHLLSDAQNVRPVELSLSLLRMLEVQKQRSWDGVVTLDE